MPGRSPSLPEPSILLDSCGQAALEQELPLRPLDPLQASGLFGIVSRRDGIDELRRVAVLIGVPPRQIIENGMRAHPAKPIRCVGVVAFTAMHDRMPETSLGRRVILADRVTSVQIASEQPQPRLGQRRQRYLVTLARR